MSNTVRATTSRPFKVGALFAGYGGLERAVQEVFPDAHPAWVSEFDAAPSRILAQRFPGVPNLGDVTKVDWAAVEPVDIITGGSPCQDLSHAGKRAGMRSGTRSGLWASMCDAIDIIRPRLVLWENVRGALSATATAGDVELCDFCMGDAGDVHLRALGRVLGDLAELGYDAAWHGLRAADVGAPHGRWRVFVLAWPAADTADLGHERAGSARRGGGRLADRR
jgi:DNA (cytosine-5)-methyltransferase 1